MVATVILIKGLIMLKKQYGRYTSVGTLKIVACVIPQLFHGINTDVTVTASSVVRLKIFCFKTSGNKNY